MVTVKKVGSNKETIQSVRKKNLKTIPQVLERF